MDEAQEQQSLLMLSINQVAAILDVSRGQVGVLIKNGQLRATRVQGRGGGEWRVAQGAIEAFVELEYARTRDRAADRSRRRRW